MRRSLAYLTLSVLLWLPSEAAPVLYTSGAPHAVIDARTISSGWSVTNSFTLSVPSIIQEVTFVVWAWPTSTLTQIDYRITESPFGVTALTSGTDASPVSTLLYRDSSHGYGFYDIFSVAIPLPALTLDAGTYYFQLGGAVTSTGDDIYWDTNYGISSAFQKHELDPTVFTRTSTTFTINGVAAESVPEIDASNATIPLILCLGLFLVIKDRRFLVSKLR